MEALLYVNTGLLVAVIGGVGKLLINYGRDSNRLTSLEENFKECQKAKVLCKDKLDELCESVSYQRGQLNGARK